MLRRMMMAGAASPATWNDQILALPNLWGWWKLDETAGASVTATDSSGNGRHGTYSAAGSQGGGLFTGSTAAQTSLGGRIDGPNYSIPAGSAFTVGALISTTHSTSAEQQILSGDGGSGQRVFQFRKNTSTHAMEIVFIYPSVVAFSGATAINDGNPHLAMFVYDESLSAGDGRVKLYLDGALDAQSTTAVTLSSGTADLGIGSRTGSNNNGLWAGALDEGFFCTGALSSTEVADLWAARNL